MGSEKLEGLLIENNNPVNNVYNFLKESDSSKFYEELFSDKFQKQPLPEKYNEVKQKHQKEGSAYNIMEEIVSFLEKELSEEAIVLEIGGGIYQQRAANAYKRFKNYFPLDISRSSIERYAKKYQKLGIIADATKLPFKSNSIDCIFTHTFLEHPIKPENVLEEIARVLKPGGIVIHNDAWFCRWWQHFGVVNLKSFASMSFKEKVIHVGAKITEFPLVRIPPIIITRIIRHFLVDRSNPVPLRYKKLNPNYTLHLGCDEDAASRIDPIDAVLFYESRGFKLMEKLTVKQRMFYPNRYITLKKKG